MNAWLLELWAAPAALGFALLFNVPPRSLIACCTLAVLGHASRKAVLDCGGDIVLDGQIGEESRHLAMPHLRRMP